MPGFVALLAVLLAAQAQAPASMSSAGQVEILWLGQSPVRISTPGGKVIVIDPFLTKNPQTPAECLTTRRAAVRRTSSSPGRQCTICNAHSSDNATAG